MSFEASLPPYSSSDPYASYLNVSCLDLLLIEMVPMAYRLAEELAISKKGKSITLDEDEQKEAAFQRLETLGYRVGQGLVERYGDF